MTLEEILTKYFGCKKPFLAKPKMVGEYIQPFTAAGARAYSELVDLIYDLDELGVINDSGKALMILDGILNERD